MAVRIQHKLCLRIVLEYWFNNGLYWINEWIAVNGILNGLHSGKLTYVRNIFVDDLLLPTKNGDFPVRKLLNYQKVSG